MAILKRFSIINKGLRYKLAIAFSLMTVIPLLSCLYLVYPYLLPGPLYAFDVNLVLCITIFISLLGFVIARSITDAVINLSIDAKKVANGEYERKIPISAEDEVGNLGQSINMMTQKIKLNLDELKSYGQSMKEINVEIQKKVLALSSLLQIGDIVSAGTAQIDLLLNMAVEKASNLFDTGYSVLYLPRHEGGHFIAKALYNVDREKLEDLVLERDGDGVFERALAKRALLQIDNSVKLTRELDEFRTAAGIINLLAIPLYSDKTLLGLFVVGNRLDGFQYTSDDKDMVAVFAKHITIAIESDILNKKNAELITRDDLTGLFNKRYVLTRMEEEIKRAIFYQRPCSFIVVNIDNFRTFRELRGELAAEDALKRIAKLVKDYTNPIGKAARIGGDEFALLLPEKNKRESSSIAEEIRKKIEITNVLKEGKATLTASIGVSENPIDGATSEELFTKAMNAVKEAKSAGKNRVVS